MKVVVAMDSFKGNMSAREACERLRDGILSVRPDAEVVLTPMADGGEGTAEALMAVRGGRWIHETVTGPLPERSVNAGYAWFADDETAVIEMAAASGIMLLDQVELNPLKTTTFGTGELMAAAMRRGAKRIILAVGGSATVDGGVGAGMALGWKFLDQDGQPIRLGGEGLADITDIRPPAEPIVMDFEVLCDVDNPLTGQHGAAVVFGPQKGATPDMVARLDGGLKRLAQVVRDQLGMEIDEVPGAGAAGGLAAGAMAFCGAKLVPGIDTVMTASGLEAHLKDADWVISGEGRFDSQSLRGKVVSGIVRMAAQYGVKAAVIAGSVKVSDDECRARGLEFAWPTAPAEMPMEVALRTAREDLQAAGRRFAEEWLTV